MCSTDVVRQLRSTSRRSCIYVRQTTLFSVSAEWSWQALALVLADHCPPENLAGQTLEYQDSIVSQVFSRGVVM